MVFLAPAKWQALHSSVCTVNYGKAKRPWRTQHGKAKWRFHPTPIKTTTQIRREEKLFASADGPCGRAVLFAPSCVGLLLSLLWAL